MIKKIRFVVQHIRFLFINFGCSYLAKICREHLFSINYYYILKYNLKLLDISTIHEESNYHPVLICKNDIDRMKKHIDKLNPADRREIISRINFYGAGFKYGYVIKKNNEITYIQWLITPEDNNILHKYFRREFELLGKNQVMLEKAFTFPRYRGQGILFHGSRAVLQIAKQSGYKSVVVYIKTDNIQSLNEFYHLGFKIIKLIREIKFFGFVFRNL